MYGLKTKQWIKTKLNATSEFVSNKSLTLKSSIIQCLSYEHAKGEGREHKIIQQDKHVTFPLFCFTMDPCSKLQAIECNKASNIQSYFFYISVYFHVPQQQNAYLWTFLYCFLLTYLTKCENVSHFVYHKYHMALW